MTSTEAQTRFGELLDTVQREPISVTRRGRVLAVILSPEELERRIGQEARRQENKLSKIRRLSRPGRGVYQNAEEVDAFIRDLRTE